MFKDDINTALITSKYVLERLSSILFVFHFSAFAHMKPAITF